MAAEDLESVLAIENESFTHPWSRQHFLDEIASPFGLPLVAVDDADRIAGYLCLKLVLDEGEILDVAVAPPFRRCGVGRLLVENALDACRAAGAAFLALEVRVGNASARSLYTTLGFRECGLRRRYYDDGEDAILMEYVF